ncbi:hypothetical protein [[Mycobacterium] nativiensis]|uniref:Transmembrane protein n=1 Tax=[Mycobacterium] nativiensis TaxID=2855503 RepID=A0ABU5Y3P3_9MYCO|nr:hypothetical protein [Mycolicibacter sp. MYC340]MEB3034677.1 hypothetical protein [Mycolicibacter sp. MYC340]
MTRVHPGWLVALFAVILSISAWLPWLTTSANGGGHASAIGGSVGSIALPPRFGVGQLIVLLSAVLLVAGAMIGRGLFIRLAAVAALVISLGIAALGVWYYQLNVVAPISAGYGLYIGAVGVAGALGCSVWALVSAARR